MGPLVWLPCFSYYRPWGTIHIRIVHQARHPSANKMGERAIRQFKVAIAAHDDPSLWLDQLLVALLGICSALNKDLGYTAVEVVYGHPLRRSGKFFTLSPMPKISVQQRLLRKLRKTCNELSPTLPHMSSSCHVFVCSRLQTTTRVSLRRHTIGPVLVTAYDGASMAPP